MGVQFKFSNNIKTLKEKFIEEILTDKANDPFEKQFIIIPNINVKKWLQLEIAKFCGISTNLELNYLEKGLVTLLKEINNDLYDKKYLFLGDNERTLDFQLLILTAINRLKNSENACDIQSILNYIKGNENSSGTIDSNKRFWQVAEKLTFYFREYEYQRSGMIAAWDDDLLFLGDDFAALETTQKLIYQKIFGSKKSTDSLVNEYSEKLEGVYTTLPRFARGVKCPAGKINKIIYIFGLSQISDFHFNILLNLSDAYEFKIFQQNYLESFVLYGENGWDYITSDTTESNPLIKEWCKPSFENLKIFKKSLEGRKFSTQYINAEPDADSSLLSVLKSKLRHENVVKKVSQDRSLQIFGTPSLKREMEAIYNSIIRNLKDDPCLKLTDIAVLVPDMDRYRIHIKSTFDSSNLISYNLSDTNAGNESVFADGLIRGLDIASGNYSRPDIIGFLLNPCVLYSLGITRETVDCWIGVFDKMNIFYSYNSDDKKNISHSDSPAFTWEYALKRIRLGRIMGGSIDNSIDKIYPFLDIDTGDVDFIDKMMVTMEELFAFFDGIKNRSLNGVQWKEKLRFFIEKYLNIPDSMKEEDSVRDSALELISNLDKFDDFMDETNIELIFISSFIKNNLSEIPASKGKYLSDGVTISLLAPMKPIPFKVVYIAGLGESLFPGRSDRSTLDLRNAFKDVGDISKTESDIYLFLELLLAAESKLYLSFVERDIEKDKEYYPSKVIPQLIEYIKVNILSDDDFELFHVPLIEESLINFTNENINNPKTDIFCSYNDKKRLMRFLYSEEYLPDYLKKLVNDRYNSLLKDNTKDLTGEADKKEIFLSNNVLYKYLEDPANARMKYALNIDETKYTVADLSIKEDEPFYEEKYDIFNLVEKCYIKKIKLIIADNYSYDDADKLIIKEFEDNLFSEMIRGYKPDGIFGDIYREKVRKKILHRLSDNYSIEMIKKTMVAGNYHFCDEIILSDGRPEEYKRYKMPVFVNKEAEIPVSAKTENVILNGSSMVFIRVKDAKRSDIVGRTKENGEALKEKEIYSELLKTLLFYGLFLKSVKSKYLYELWVFCNDKPVVVKIDDFDKVTDWIDSLVNDYCEDTGFDNIPIKFIVSKSEIYEGIFKSVHMDTFENSSESYESLFYKAFCDELEEYFENDYKKDQQNELTVLSKAVVPLDVFEKLQRRLSILKAVTIDGEANLCQAEQDGEI